MRFSGHPGLAVLLCALPWSISHAAEGQTKAPVVLRYAGNDLVGLALSVALHEELDLSSTLRPQTPDIVTPRIVLIVATVDGSVEDPEKQTAASINIVYDADTLPLNGYLVAGLVQVCGLARTHECAREILDAVDGAVAKLQTDNPDLWLSLQPQ